MLDWFAERWNDFIQVCMSFLLTLWDILVDISCYVFDAVFTVCLSIVSGLGGAFSSFGILQYLNMLPPSMLNVMALVGVNEVSSIIVSAVVVRFILQLIPFVRLGS
ncbi:DUF2523 family protein [Vibrio anguillarum]|uniref:DUF2523 family protein n=1 Tax=Vibrio anguillarum TaxID=55601 RepID=UPI0016AB1C94|nr:DUF2523 family protein [Vibrio anguillarum]NOI06982.1 DUF2523 domain-containing protein [Vibrio anguillarum]